MAIFALSFCSYAAICVVAWVSYRYSGLSVVHYVLYGLLSSLHDPGDVLACVMHEQTFLNLKVNIKKG